MAQRALEGGALCLMQEFVWFQFPHTLQTATPKHEPNEVHCSANTSKAVPIAEISIFHPIIPFSFTKAFEHLSL